MCFPILCNVKGCKKRKIRNSKYCYVHTCTVYYCNNKTNGLTFYCRLHDVPNYGP